MTRTLPMLIAAALLAVAGNAAQANVISNGSFETPATSTLIVVGAGHRHEAFAACEYVLERIKQSVPIWKKEIGDGGERWVPGETSGGGA